MEAIADRQAECSGAAIQTYPTLKVLFDMALRQKTGFLEGLLSLVGSTRTVPDLSTLSRCLKTLAVNTPYSGSKGPLHLLIDGTGIKADRRRPECGLQPETERLLVDPLWTSSGRK